ncbi:MAG TPA: hypothetical protein GXZ90_01570 [Clostridiales bacterium]|nr:hypothetical protein [Clostridiales bacterium]
MGEFVALCTFAFLFSHRILNIGVASLIAFLYLIFILLQGSIYWFYRYILMVKKADFSPRAIKIFRSLRPLNMFLLVCGGVLIPIIKSSNKDLIIAIGVFLFGVIEYINYYWYRLSYGKSGFNIRILLNTKLKKSSINKMINK